MVIVAVACASSALPLAASTVKVSLTDGLEDGSAKVDILEARGAAK